MPGFIYTISTVIVVLLGVWAYHEGYETRETEKAVARLERQIGQTHQELSMLRAEWAYLNRPDRLAALAEMNFERLGLMPLASDHFATTEQVGYPLPVLVAESPETVLVAEDFSDFIIMNHRYGAATPPRMIAPPTLADDGEQLP